jgi:hypothetical protein
MLKRADWRALQSAKDASKYDDPQLELPLGHIPSRTN